MKTYSHITHLQIFSPGCQKNNIFVTKLLFLSNAPLDRSAICVLDEERAFIAMHGQREAQKRLRTLGVLTSLHLQSKVLCIQWQCHKLAECPTHQPLSLPKWSSLSSILFYFLCPIHCLLVPHMLSANPTWLITQNRLINDCKLLSAIKKSVQWASSWHIGKNCSAALLDSINFFSWKITHSYFKCLKLYI